MVAVIQVSVIAILIAVGYFLAKTKIFTAETGEQLSFLLVNFVTPALILDSFQIDYSPEKIHSLVLTALLGFLSYAVLIVFSFLYCGKKPQAKVERLSLLFSNVGFMGLPLVGGMYGDEGVFYGSIMVIIFNVVFWTYGITVIQGEFSRKNLKKLLLSPTLLAVIVGLCMFLFRLHLPEPLRSVAKHLANLNTPLAMIVAGISISQSNILAALKNKKLYQLLTGKLILAPLLIAAVFLLLPINPLIKKILVLQVACPTGASVSITLLQQHMDNRTATEYFAMTTLISMVTIPIIHTICGFLF